jgi:hypothetical protein
VIRSGLDVLLGSDPAKQSELDRFSILNTARENLLMNQLKHKKVFTKRGYLRQMCTNTVKYCFLLINGFKLLFVGCVCRSVPQTTMTLKGHTHDKMFVRS